MKTAASFNLKEASVNQMQVHFKVHKNTVTGLKINIDMHGATTGWKYDSSEEVIGSFAPLKDV